MQAELAQFSMDFILFTAICACFAIILLFCILGATEALAMNCSNCAQSHQSPVKSPKSCNSPKSCESFYSLDILYPDESVSLSSLESTVRNMDKSTTAPRCVSAAEGSPSSRERAAAGGPPGRVCDPRSYNV